ncbi:hypothetical protein HELRODRAFT_182753 [Helobdella robusta]|uniref:Threonylcarbamoyl-AMP synthase n=1 Tax=Helobdella robusta TaxID=6412 RepID=T1FIP2_HELRO|nr:hypothetical protein HELRODRAFT_182753 [Helobdella robusta]ESN90150.1 hypothetical protein HELRODRAFT_182753 [Helobdella robusta]
MKDNIVQLNCRREELDYCVERAVKSLQKGHIIAIPTDTIYGLACLAQNNVAIDKLYTIKSRQLNKPISISVGCVEDIFKWANVTVSKALLNDLLPGPVTVVFERSTSLNNSLNPQTQLVGLRIPQDKFIQDICTKCSNPIALTSANISSHESALNIQEFSELWPSIDLIFDGGPITANNSDKSGSTVVDLSRPDHYFIIRRGW